ncbi:MAG: class I SAM-dependent methyltransferase [Woeseiaceae bacterium]
MDRKEHWEYVYESKPADRVGWYKPHLQTSIEWIRDLGLEKNAPIIDIGGGASTLVDDLLGDSYRAISVLDISEVALAQIRQRIGEKAGEVTWLAGDVTTIELPPRTYELWHDRAMFHFLTSADQQKRYRDNLLAALKPAGHVIIGTFSPEAPPKCSGLPVQRYDEERLVATLGNELELIRHHKEMHITPGGVEQLYLYCQFRKTVR